MQKSVIVLPVAFPLSVGTKVYFENERTPYVVMACSKRYCIVSRKFNRREDASLIRHKVEMGAYCTFTEAYKSMRDECVYSIIDFERLERGPDNLVFGSFDYSKKHQCELAIKELECGDIELSSRSKVELKIKMICNE